MEWHYKASDEWFAFDRTEGRSASDVPVSTVTLEVLLRSDYNLFTVDEVAEALRLSGNTVRKLVQDGELKAMKLGTNYRITRGGLEALQQE